MVRAELQLAVYKVRDSTPSPKKDLVLTKPDEKVASGAPESAVGTVNNVRG